MLVLTARMRLCQRSAIEAGVPHLPRPKFSGKHYRRWMDATMSCTTLLVCDISSQYDLVLE
jgi:hypothetical protein